jgi:hypothetical protein
MGTASLRFLQGCGSFLDIQSASPETTKFNDSSTETKIPTLAENGKDDAPAHLLPQSGIQALGVLRLVMLI